MKTNVNFELALSFVLKWEGGLSDNPDDPGGLTYRGVTQKAYDEFRKQFNMSPRKVTYIEDFELKSFYEIKYWDRCFCNLLDKKLSLAIFDCAVNLGPKRAIKFIQQCLNLKVDGIFGTKTHDAIVKIYHGENAEVACDLFLKCLLDRREIFYLALGKRKPMFLKGWLNRLNDLREILKQK